MSPMRREVEEIRGPEIDRFGDDVSSLLSILEERARAEPRGVVDTVKVVAGEHSRTVEREPRP